MFQTVDRVGVPSTFQDKIFCPRSHRKSRTYQGNDGSVRPPPHLLTTLLHHAIHNPTTWESLPLQLHRPGTAVKGVGFPGERQRELQDIPCASSAHTIKLFPYYLIHSSPHTAIPFYFCPIFYYLLTYRTASCTQQKVSLYHDAGCYPGLFLHTWKLGCF